ncbi:MAG: CBS domain-containing protein [Thermodesulfobacteriota bacterium]
MTDEPKVKDLMVPLGEYATVSEDATLYDAVMALEEAQRRFDQSRDRHRAILVLDRRGKVVGKLSQHDVIRGLEPRYDRIGDFRGSSRMGFSPEFIRSLLEKYALWEKPLKEICKKSTTIKVKDIYYTPTQGEFVKEEDTLNTAIHQLVVGHHQSLLVTRDKEVVGILRLSDVFMEVCKMIKQCGI